MPPSGRFIAQLFLVPGIIVVGAVTVLWGFSWLIGASRTPEQFLKELSSTNVDVRRRAASDDDRATRSCERCDPIDGAVDYDRFGARRQFGDDLVYARCGRRPDELVETSASNSCVQ